MSFDIPSSLPLWTGDLPGTGGCIKTVPEDFEVEEIPAYEPSGSGEFLYLWIEKRDMGAEYFLRQVARRLDIPVGTIGSAGLKDRRAVTRQMISVPAEVADRVQHLEGDDLRVLRISRHGNKLKPGHLHGNRFRVRVRGADPAAQERLQPLLERLQRDGLPNFYGPQRFGRDGETGQVGLALLRGQPFPATVAGREDQYRKPFLRKLALSAAQAALFNHYLARRIKDGLLRRVRLGDVMAKWPWGGMFVAKDIAAEQARFEAREIVSTGPIFGRKMFPAEQDAAAYEAAVLQEAGLERDHFHAFGKLLQGTRRHNLVYVADLTADVQLDSIQLSFSLPAGSYATVLLREIMKCPMSEGEEEL